VVTTAAGDVDALTTTPGDEDGIEELAAVVGVPLFEGEGESLADEMHCTANSLFSYAPDGLKLCPAASHIHSDQSGQEKACGAFTAV
jgi:hypothetical protein